MKQVTEERATALREAVKDLREALADLSLRPMPEDQYRRVAITAAHAATIEDHVARIFEGRL